MVWTKAQEKYINYHSTYCVRRVIPNKLRLEDAKRNKETFDPYAVDVYTYPPQEECTCEDSNGDRCTCSPNNDNIRED